MVLRLWVPQQNLLLQPRSDSNWTRVQVPADVKHAVQLVFLVGELWIVALQKQEEEELVERFVQRTTR